MASDERAIHVRLTHGNEVVRKEISLSQLTSLMDLKCAVRMWLNINRSFLLQRKSKRANTYIDLETSKDFKSLKRSLEVKDTLKLKIIDQYGDTYDPYENQCTPPYGKNIPFGGPQPLENFRSSECNNKEFLVRELKSLQLQLDLFQKKLHQEKMRNKKLHCKEPTIPATTATPDEKLITAKNSLDINADFFIDIPFSSHGYRDRLVSLIQKYNTASKLLELSENNHHFEKLMSYVNGDVDALFKAVKDSLGQQDPKSQTPPDYHVHVNLSVVDSKLKFVLTNNDIWKIPKNIKLVLQILNNNGHAIYTINLFLGDNTMKRRLQRTIYYNLDGIDKNKILSEGYVKLMLIKDDATLYRVGYGEGLGLGEVFMREPSHGEDQSNEKEVLNEESSELDSASSDKIKIETPVAVPVPAKTPVAVPTETPVETPAKTPVAAPVAAPAETPAAIPAEISVEGSLKTPERDSPTSSSFVTPSGSTVLINLLETKAEKAPPTLTPTSTPVTQTSFEELVNSNATLINNVMLPTPNLTTRAININIPSTEEDETDFSEISEVEDMLAGDYDILSADDYLTDL